MQPMDWNDYQAFLAIARTGQISRAAIVMGVDPTTLGRRLRRLEAQLGTSLFEQTRNGQVLTEAGEAMLVKVEAMEQSAAQIAESQMGATGPTGLLRVSVSEGFGNSLVAQNIADFTTQYPQLAVDIVANNGFLSPSKREADIAVTLSRPKAGPVIAGKLSDYTLQLYGPASLLTPELLAGDHRALLHRFRLIGYIPDMLYAPELNYLDELEPGLTPSLRSSSIRAQHKMIAAGAGIGILPCFLGEGDADLVKLLPDWRLTRSFWVVTHKDNRQLAKIRAFRDWLQRLVDTNRHRLRPG